MACYRIADGRTCPRCGGPMRNGGGVCFLCCYMETPLPPEGARRRVPASKKAPKRKLRHGAE